MRNLQMLIVATLIAVIALQLVECAAQKQSAQTVQLGQSANVTAADDGPLCKTLRKSSNFRDCVKLCGYLDDICLQKKYRHKMCTDKCQKLFPE